MVTPRRIELALWTVVGVAAVVAVVAWRSAFARTPMTAAASVPTLRILTQIDGRVIDEAGRSTTAADPFRLDRHPAAVPYQPGVASVPEAAPPPKPVLALKGIVGAGRLGRWAAFIDGIPGHDGVALVRGGATVGGFRIVRIGRDTVVVSGADTTWTLTLHRAWQ